MKIQVQRLYKKDTYTIGKMFIDGKYFCDTLEDKDRGLNSSMSESQIASLVQGCIGIGKNKIKGGLLEGKETFKKLYSILSSCNNDQIEIEII